MSDTILNDVAKQCICDKLMTAIQTEGLTQSQAAKLFGFDGSYVSSIKNPSYWSLVSRNTWEILQKWVNSGVSIKKYTESHKSLPETASEIKSIEQMDEEKCSVTLAEIGWILGLSSKGKSCEQIAKELKIYPRIVEAILSTKSGPLTEKVKEVEFLQVPTDKHELCNLFASIWCEMIKRDLLVPFLKESGYSGKLTKEIIF